MSSVFVIAGEAAVHLDAPSPQKLWGEVTKPYFYYIYATINGSMFCALDLTEVSARGFVSVFRPPLEDD